MQQIFKLNANNLFYNLGFKMLWCYSQIITKPYPFCQT